MAKQHVSPLERHLDKAILAIAGLILLWALVSYLIMSPHEVEYAGEPRDPGELYLAIESQAQRTLESLRRAEPDESKTQDPATPIVNPNNKISPIRSDPNLKTTLATAFASPGVEVPDIQETLSGDVTLARILPLKKPLLTQGKGYVDIPAPEPTEIGRSPGATNRNRAAAGFPQEYRWVTLWTFLNRKAQRELFEEAGYDFGRQKVMVASVEVQRQEMQPDGGWGQPQTITTTYDPFPLRGIKERVAVRDDGGTHSVDMGDMNHIDNVRKVLEGRDGQQTVLRPAFQEFLGSQEWRWQPPAELTGDEDLVWQKYAVRLYDLSDDALRRRPGAGRDTDRAAAGGTAYYRETIKKAQDHLDKKEFLDAYRLLSPIADSTDPDNRLAQQASDLLAQHQQRFQQALRDHERELEAQATAAEVYYGDDLDPVWVNDYGVRPGKRYRYRARPILLNSYAGAPALLKNPEDGGKILLQGEWSAWSPDILVQPDTYMFFTGANQQQRSADVELFRWSAGNWQSTPRVPFGIGDNITAERGNVRYEYDGVVADLEFNRPFSKREENGGSVSYQETQTPALTLVSAQGRVEERLAEQDNMERSRLRDQIKNEEKIAFILKNDPETLIIPPPEDVQMDGFAPRRDTFLEGPGFGGGPGDLRDSRDRPSRRDRGGRQRPRGGSLREGPPS